MNGLKSAVVLVLAVIQVRGHLVWNDPELQPVQGLYVKPSSDGISGDLYVAATEDNGVQSQWLTEQPVNFLRAPSQHQHSAIPHFASNNDLSGDETLIATQKRAVINDQAANYYNQHSGTPETAYAPYNYAGIPSAKTEALPATESSQVQAAPTPAAIPQYSPYHYMYPHMMYAAYANAVKAYQDAGKGKEDSSINNKITPFPTAMWPTTSYYPMQYLMMDPTAWAKSQATAVSGSTIAATTSAPTTDDPNSD